MENVKELNGLELAGFIKNRQAKQVRALRQAHHIQPRLAIVTDVENPVIETYMRLKQRYGTDILIETEICRTDDDNIEKLIDELNDRDDIQAIIIQLPTSNSLRVDDLLQRVRPEKDVDGLRRDSLFDAATPIAINWLLAGYNINLAQKNIAIVGCGRLVGAPLRRMWQNSGYRITTLGKGDDLTQLQDYEVVVSATGVPGLIKSSMIRQGAVVVDAGTASEDGVIVGDVDDAVRQRDDIIITPQKGGVGPLTVAALFDNVIQACLKIANKN